MDAATEQRITRPGRARRAGRGSSERRGVALLLVLLVVSLGAVLTLRLVQVVSLRSALARELVASKRAEYLAESGIGEAAYWLRHPELTAGVVWAGAQNRKPDSSNNNYYNVSVAQDGTKPARYIVSSEGHLIDAGGEEMVRIVKGTFQMYYGTAEAVVAAGDLLIPAGMTIRGNLYAGGNVNNQGTISGSIWAGGAVANTGWITGLISLGVAARNIGVYPVGDVMTYTWDQAAYPAEMVPTDANTDAALGPSESNPMGVWQRQGSMHLYGTSIVEGTLVVSTDLYLEANSTTVITPKPGFPALVVQGNLNLDGDAVVANLHGAVVVLGSVQTPAGSMPNSQLTIQGPLILTGAGFAADFAAEAKIVIDYDLSHADVSNLFGGQPHTIAGARQAVYREDGS